jgi:3-oxoacyl-[acyl-carrier-protein] synthase II
MKSLCPLCLRSEIIFSQARASGMSHSAEFRDNLTACREDLYEIDPTPLHKMHCAEIIVRDKNGKLNRVVVTGMGVISPLGLDTHTTWQQMVNGESGVGRITRFDASSLPTQIVAEVKGFDSSRYFDAREARRIPLFSQYAIAAAHEALHSAGVDVDAEDHTRLGVELGSALGGTGVVEEQRVILEYKGARHVNPALIPSLLINSAACSIAIQFGCQGIVSAPAAACATGTMAIGEACRRLALGEMDLMLAGGCESVITPLGITSFSRLGASTQRNDLLEQACAPFDANRDGTVVGEGAAVLVLETLEHAQKRNAAILAEVVGYGYSNDAYHIVAPDPSGLGPARAMKNALSDAELDPEQVDWICAHGTGTVLNDVSETRAIKMAFAEWAYRIPASSIKGAVGHMLGAAGAISAAMAIKALESGVLPPTLNYRTPDPECDLDYVPNQSRRKDISHALVNSFGFGGQNACLVLRKW